jgi:hypothetical protein
MTEHESAVTRFPLAWPVGWVRTLSYKRQRAPFSTKKAADGLVSVRVATIRLEGELDRLGAKFPVLSTNVQLRLDGSPRSDIEPPDPGAAVYFTFKGRATVLACDRYKRVADNITAMASHIDALRRIDRYGVGTIEQALAGYKALPADSAADWRTVFGFARDVRVTTETLDAEFKRLARQRHPDTGGTEEGMQQLNRAHDFARAELNGG